MPGAYMTVDNETDVPYMVPGWDPSDVQRGLARAHGEVDNSSANPSWFREEPRDDSVSENRPPMPPRGPAGYQNMADYHAARAAYYEQKTGKPLEGTPKQQTQGYNNATRMFRAQTADGRPNTMSSRLPKPQD